MLPPRKREVPSRGGIEYEVREEILAGVLFMPAQLLKFFRCERPAEEELRAGGTKELLEEVLELCARRPHGAAVVEEQIEIHDTAYLEERCACPSAVDGHSRRLWRGAAPANLSGGWRALRCSPVLSLLA
jgi:hypothetical protein